MALKFSLQAYDFWQIWSYRISTIRATSWSTEGANMILNNAIKSTTDKCVTNTKWRAHDLLIQMKARRATVGMPEDNDATQPPSTQKQQINRILCATGSCLFFCPCFRPSRANFAMHPDRPQPLFLVAPFTAHHFEETNMLLRFPHMALEPIGLHWKLAFGTAS